MGELKNLEGKEAIEKMRKLIESEDVCMFATRLNQLPLDIRPMSTSGFDNDGSLWFMSHVNSTKNTDIHEDDRVQLFYANKGSSEYLSIYGRASITQDRNIIEELWSPVNKAWFAKGKDDPDITLIHVEPLDAYYWDNKGNKMVSLIKKAEAALL